MPALRFNVLTACISGHGKGDIFMFDFQYYAPAELFLCH